MDDEELMGDDSHFDLGDDLDIPDDLDLPKEDLEEEDPDDKFH